MAGSITCASKRNNNIKIGGFQFSGDAFKEPGSILHFYKGESPYAAFVVCDQDKLSTMALRIRTQELKNEKPVEENFTAKQLAEAQFEYGMKVLYTLEVIKDEITRHPEDAQEILDAINDDTVKFLPFHHVVALLNKGLIKII